MTIDKQLEELAWNIGEAIQHRAVMTATFRNEPNSTVAEWLQGARAKVRKLQARWRRLQTTKWREWNQPAG